MIRILILTRRFEYGGAERQLVALVKGLDKTRFSLTVVPFYEGGPLLQEVECIPGVQVLPLYKSGRWDVIPFLWRLWQAVVLVKPHIVYGYMGVANQLSLLVGWLVRGKVVWGIRASNMDLDQYGWLARMLYQLECRTSRFPAFIISNSQSGKRYHADGGFPNEKIVVIPNGIDTDRFAPDQKLREKVRAEWGLTERETLIGLVARLDQMKGHPTFLRAAAFLSCEQPNLRFVCVGDGDHAYRQKIRDLSEELGLTATLRWVGFRDDIVAVYSALDVACSSSSFGEGFSNAVGEAMACGVPCVVTDVGDSKWIVGDTGYVVVADDPKALAASWHKMLDMGGAARGMYGQRARERVIKHFSLDRMIDETARVFEARV